MTVSGPHRPAELVLMAGVARRYYLAGQSRVDISEELQISRFQVARLLEKARSTGLVRIEIGHPSAIDLDASGRLQDAFGLQHSLVVDVTAVESGPVRAQLGAAAAALLTEIVTPHDVLGLAWARSVSATANAVTSLASVPVVQLTGSLSGIGIEDSSVELVRGLSRLTGAPAYYFYVPMAVPDAATANALRLQPEVARAFAQFGSVTKAVVGIGLWSQGGSTLHDSATTAERRRLREQGVCAEFSGVFASADGEILQVDLADRVIGLTAEHMRAIPEVLAVPYGVEKAPAVLAALRSGLVTSLVTHTSLANALLSP